MFIIIFYKILGLVCSVIFTLFTLELLDSIISDILLTDNNNVNNPDASSANSQQTGEASPNPGNGPGPGDNSPMSVDSGHNDREQDSDGGSSLDSGESSSDNSEIEPEGHRYRHEHYHGRAMGWDDASIHKQYLCGVSEEEFDRFFMSVRHDVLLDATNRHVPQGRTFDVLDNLKSAKTHCETWDYRGCPDEGRECLHGDRRKDWGDWLRDRTFTHRDDTYQNQNRDPEDRSA